MRGKTYKRLIYLICRYCSHYDVLGILYVLHYYPQIKVLYCQIYCVFIDVLDLFNPFSALRVLCIGQGVFPVVFVGYFQNALSWDSYIQSNNLMIFCNIPQLHCLLLKTD